MPEQNKCRQKRIAAIHDISGVGKCSLTVALPVVSAAGIECCVIPTAVLSTHTGGFKGYTFCDLTSQILPTAKHWAAEGFCFDALYSGYLGSKEQVDILANAIKLLKDDNTLIAVDPAMADNGKLYNLFSPDFPFKMRELCKQADVITPNITEACLMLEQPFIKPPYSKEYIETTLKKLSELTKKYVVLTGVCFDESKLGAAAYNKLTGEVSYSLKNNISGIYHGTGDIFSSVLVSALVKGCNMQAAINAATEFVCMAIENTKKYNNLWYGVAFEDILFKLPALLEEKHGKV